MSKLGYLFPLAIILLLLSCKENNVNTPEDTRQSFEIDLTDYSPNYFFLDTIYASVLPKYNLYNNYHQSIPSIDPYFRIKSLRIWKEKVSLIDTTLEIRSNAFINLPPLRKNEKHDSTFYDITQPCIIGETMIYNRFISLLEGTDYTYNSYTGVVYFFKDVTTYDAFAATYVIEGPTSSPDDDIYFGNSESKENAILKLFRPERLQPNFKQAWKLQLRNIYPIGDENIIKDGFELDIKIDIDGKFQDYIEVWGKSSQLLTEFDFDRIGESGIYGADGKFDFLDRITINPAKGEIIFPMLEPFGRDLPKNIPDSFKVFSLYDTANVFVEATDIPFKITGKYNN